VDASIEKAASNMTGGRRAQNQQVNYNTPPRIDFIVRLLATVVESVNFDLTNEPFPPCRDRAIPSSARALR
jgi:hypothetical protein